MSSTVKPLRCGQCKKKLGVLGFTCKCERHFCISHLQPQEHQCTFDFKKEAEKEIQTKMDSEPRASSFERM
jgi:predicted nucleic acid binding AN1-type Zn finger protein